jgi:hypothetical protein
MQATQSSSLRAKAPRRGDEQVHPQKAQKATARPQRPGVAQANPFPAEPPRVGQDKRVPAARPQGSDATSATDRSRVSKLRTNTTQSEKSVQKHSCCDVPDTYKPSDSIESYIPSYLSHSSLEQLDSDISSVQQELEALEFLQLERSRCSRISKPAVSLAGSSVVIEVPPKMLVTPGQLELASMGVRLRRSISCDNNSLCSTILGQSSSTLLLQEEEKDDLGNSDFIERQKRRLRATSCSLPRKPATGNLMSSILMSVAQKDNIRADTYGHSRVTRETAWRGGLQAPILVLDESNMGKPAGGDAEAHAPVANDENADLFSNSSHKVPVEAAEVWRSAVEINTQVADEHEKLSTNSLNIRISACRIRARSSCMLR